MAVSLVANEVSDLCIGKPPLRSLPLSATVGEALLSLRRCDDSYLSVWTTATATATTPTCVGKVCVVDVVCFLCSEANIADPCKALKTPVATLFLKGGSEAADLIRRVERHSSILEALDLILDGAQNIVVPIRPSALRKKHLHNQQPNAATVDFCCLTQEDFVRFFLNSIGHFSAIASLSVNALGLISPDFLAVRYHDPALSAAPLIKRAATLQTAVAVLTDDGKLIGEISPSTLAMCGGEAVAGAVAALSAGELMAYIDCGRPPHDVVDTVKARLMEKGLKGMVELMEDEDEDDSEVATVFSLASSSSDEEEGKRRFGRRYSRTGSYSARMGRRSEEAIVCHPRSSLVAVMMQALAHRVSYVWVVEDDYELAGVVAFRDVLRVFREVLMYPSSAAEL